MDDGSMTRGVDRGRGKVAGEFLARRDSCLPVTGRNQVRKSINEVGAESIMIQAESIPVHHESFREKI